MRHVLQLITQAIPIQLFDAGQVNEDTKKCFSAELLHFLLWLVRQRAVQGRAEVPSFHNYESVKTIFFVSRTTRQSILICARACGL